MKILLNMDEEAHSSIEILRLVRSLFENQKHRNYISTYAGVCEMSIISEAMKLSLIMKKTP